MKRRAASLASVALLAYVCASRSARADSYPAPSPCAADAAPIALASASHHAQRVEEGVQWDARYIMTLEASSAFQGGRVMLATPLPAHEALHRPVHVSPLVEADEIVGFCFDKEAQDSALTPWSLAGRTLTASVALAVVPSGDRAFHVGVPLAAGSFVQIIDPALTLGRRIEVIDPLVDKHMTFIAPASLSRGAREEAERLTGAKSGLRNRPIYLRGDDARAREGIEGRIVEPPNANRQHTALAATAVFATIVGALGMAARRLRRSATMERVDALLAGEIDDLSMEAPNAKEPP